MSDHGFDRTASHNAGEYRCICGDVFCLQEPQTRDDMTFDEYWMKVMVPMGYQYGDEELEAIRFGWNLHRIYRDTFV